MPGPSKRKEEPVKTLNRALPLVLSCAVGLSVGWGLAKGRPSTTASLYQGKDPKEAAAALQKALALEPKDDASLTKLGCIRNLKGDRPGAEEYFSKALAVRNDDNWNTLNMAASYLGMLPF
jgi:tetratricopeptide (TPR) repeat protein